LTQAFFSKNQGFVASCGLHEQAVTDTRRPSALRHWSPALDWIKCSPYQLIRDRAERRTVFQQRTEFPLMFLQIGRLLRVAQLWLGHLPSVNQWE
jgi:hypothetical protein